MPRQWQPRNLVGTRKPSELLKNNLMKFDYDLDWYLWARKANVWAVPLDLWYYFTQLKGHAS